MVNLIVIKNIGRCFKDYRNSGKILSDPTRSGIGFFDLGMYERMGKKTKLLEHRENVIRYSQVIEAVLECYTQNIGDSAVACSRIASIYMDMKNSSKSLEFYRKVIYILVRLPHLEKSDLVTTYDKIGQIYQEMGHDKTACIF